MSVGEIIRALKECAGNEVQAVLTESRQNGEPACPYTDALDAEYGGDWDQVLDDAMEWLEGISEEELQEVIDKIGSEDEDGIDEDDPSPDPSSDSDPGDIDEMIVKDKKTGKKKELKGKAAQKACVKAVLKKWDVGPLGKPPPEYRKIARFRGKNVKAKKAYPDARDAAAAVCVWAAQRKPKMTGKFKKPTRKGGKYYGYGRKGDPAKKGHKNWNKSDFRAAKGKAKKAKGKAKGRGKAVRVKRKLGF